MVGIPILAVTPAPVAVIITAVAAIVMAVAIITVAVERIMLGGSIREVSSLDMRPGPIIPSNGNVTELHSAPPLLHFRANCLSTNQPISIRLTRFLHQMVVCAEAG